ncbi:hypothetical protein pipiens_013357 [Culex pipiens pipiens]|uniref:Uncharacterized protein n=1 Tax=Culex pipiens pipiens TaxID=38569 RepID=A0ABD1CYR3_CULPP
MDFDHGKTTLGFRFQGEVILTVDSRATGGQFIGSQTMQKIVEFNEYLLGTLAGGAADCVGSIYAYGVLGSGDRSDLSNEDVHDLGRHAIYHATHRDAFSGGIVSVFRIKPTGWINMSMNLHFKYRDEKKQKFGS